MSEPKKKKTECYFDPKVWLKCLNELNSEDVDDLDDEKSGSGESDNVQNSNHDTETEQSEATII